MATPTERIYIITSGEYSDYRVDEVLRGPECKMADLVSEYERECEQKDRAAWLAERPGVNREGYWVYYKYRPFRDWLVASKGFRVAEFPEVEEVHCNDLGMR